MGPRKFFNHAAEAAPSPNSGLRIGSVGTDQDIVTHQIAIAHDSILGQESITVLCADVDPNSNDLSTFTVPLSKGSEIQPQDVHIGDAENGEDSVDLRMISTMLGEVSIRLYESNVDPGIYDGLVETRAHGSLIAQLYTAKFRGRAAFHFNAEAYAEFQEGV